METQTTEQCGRSIGSTWKEGNPQAHSSAISSARVADSSTCVVALRANISVVPITDTSPAARAKQDEILRAMSGEQRITLAYEMSMFVRELMREGIRRDHPEWTEAQIARELLRRAFFPAPLPGWVK